MKWSEAIKVSEGWYVSIHCDNWIQLNDPGEVLALAALLKAQGEAMQERRLKQIREGK